MRNSSEKRPPANRYSFRLQYFHFLRNLFRDFILNVSNIFLTGIVGIMKLDKTYWLN